ncbi:hypothetical protein, partial [Streptomyces sp. NPDC052042]|uniref:hypothetical protein n=1 Tax=Streptomyces sp. NPDC052042 TaxID=3365683 RepID=UPI0037CD2C57
MDRSFRLQDEDRADYAAALDEVIESAEIQRLLARSHLGKERLRATALAATARIASAAEAEYRSYTERRQRLCGEVRDDRAASSSGPGHQERTGAGLVPVLAVLTPLLAAVAAGTFLLLGYGMRFTDSLPDMADTLVSSGWISLGIAALTAVVGLVALYRTAAEHREPTARTRPATSPDVDQARTVWLAALRDAGIRPFLVARLGEEAAAAGTGRASGSDRRPRFSSPDFGRPDFGGPDYSAPDFSSPGFDGPGHNTQDTKPDHNRPDYTSPDFSTPHYSSPGFDGPGHNTQDTKPDHNRPDYTSPDFSTPH